MPTSRRRRWVLGAVGGLAAGMAGCSTTDNPPDETPSGDPNNEDENQTDDEQDGDGDESDDEQDGDGDESDEDSGFVQYMGDIFSARDLLTESYPFEALKESNEELNELLDNIYDAEELTPDDFEQVKQTIDKQSDSWEKISDAYVIDERGQNAIEHTFDHWDSLLSEAEEYTEFNDWNSAYDTLRDNTSKRVSFGGYSQFINRYQFEPNHSLLYVDILPMFQNPDTTYLSAINHLFGLRNFQFGTYQERYTSEIEIRIPEITDDDPLQIFTPFNDIVSDTNTSELQLESGPAHFYIRADSEDGAKMIVEEIRDASQLGDSETLTFGEYERVAWDVAGGTRYGYLKQEQNYVFIGCTHESGTIWDEQDMSNSQRVTWLTRGVPDEIVNV